MTIKQGSRVVTARGKLVSLQQPTEEREIQKWKHRWREELRWTEFANLARRREMFQELVEGVHCAWTRVLFEILENPQWKYHVAMTLAGAQVTAYTRHLVDPTSPAQCPYCQEDDETQEHRMSVCEHFQAVRRRWVLKSLS